MSYREEKIAQEDKSDSENCITKGIRIFSSSRESKVIISDGGNRRKVARKAAVQVKKPLGSFKSTASVEHQQTAEGWSDTDDPVSTVSTAPQENTDEGADSDEQEDIHSVARLQNINDCIEADSDEPVYYVAHQQSMEFEADSEDDEPAETVPVVHQRFIENSAEADSDADDPTDTAMTYNRRKMQGRSDADSDADDPTDTAVTYNKRKIQGRSAADPDDPTIIYMTRDQRDTQGRSETVRIPQLRTIYGGSTPEGSSSEDPPRQKRPRCQNMDTWKKVQAKKLRNSGQAYVSRTGKTVRARKMGLPCGNRCKLKCKSRIPDGKRTPIFERFWALGSLQLQREFLTSCIEKKEPERRRTTPGREPRQPNCEFFLTVDGARERVCKTFLTGTLDVGERTIRTVIGCVLSGAQPVDRRGRHDNHRKLDPELTESVRDHIGYVLSIETLPGEVTAGGLSVLEMHRHYCAERGAGMPAATYDAYLKIFNEEFNDVLFLPKKKQRCDVCEGRNVKKDEKYRLHRDEEALSRIEREMDEEMAAWGAVHLAVYGMQAVLPLPIHQSSAFFYKSRLNCFNFTVNEIGGDNHFCYFWHEGLGKRGVDETGSCLLLYLEDLSKRSPLANAVLYSDGFGVQQNNRYLISLFLYAVQRFDIASITHKSLLRGHTYEPTDSIDDVIERELAHARKCGPIYVPGQYVTVLRNAKRTGAPLAVREMNYSDFKDVKDLSKGTEFDLEMNLSEVRLMRFEKSSSGVVYFKNGFGEEDWRRMNCKRSAVPDDVVLKPAYTQKIPIAENKILDLNTLVQSNVIPQFYASFYDSLN